jgi:hypothetical protein
MARGQGSQQECLRALRDLAMIAFFDLRLLQLFSFQFAAGRARARGRFPRASPRELSRAEAPGNREEWS